MKDFIEKFELKDSTMIYRYFRKVYPDYVDTIKAKSYRGEKIFCDEDLQMMEQYRNKSYKNRGINGSIAARKKRLSNKS
jgi:hypothetical protein